MTKLLWLVVLALGHRMLWEMSYHLTLRWMGRLQSLLRWGAWLWVVGLVSTAIWWIRAYQ
jgi:hypothetical protein